MKTAADILKDKDLDMICISPDQTIREALQIMHDNGIGGLPVKEDKDIIGIWTERDLARDILTSGFNLEMARVRDYMTTKLYTAPYDSPILKLQEMFLGLFIRHILIEKKGDFVGLLSIGDVLRASLLEKDKQISKLTSIASWEYYDNWGWDRKRKIKKK